MVLLDSNIVIYLRNAKYAPGIAKQLEDQAVATNNIIITEVLGYAALPTHEIYYFQELFEMMKNYSFDVEVTQKVIELRRTTKLRLPDAIVAATALVHNLTLWTHNITDFSAVPGLRLFDPLAV